MWLHRMPERCAPWKRYRQPPPQREALLSGSHVVATLSHARRGLPEAVEAPIRRELGPRSLCRLSLLIVDHSPDGVIVITNTLAPTVEGESYLLVTKCGIVPHLNMVIASGSISTTKLYRWPDFEEMWQAMNDRLHREAEALPDPP